jgi:hypothetical protein
MRLGLLADVHECLPNLEAALARLAAEGVERIVFLGDLCETGRHLGGAAAMLRAAGAVGVFGNHDMGLVVEPDPEFRARFDPAGLAYLDSLADVLVLEECRFSHVQAWMDPRDWRQPWYLHDAPESAEEVTRCLEAAPQRVQFQGHYHRWLVADRHGRRRWAGESAIELDPAERFVVVVDAVLGGWCGIYDTSTGRLTPHRIGPAHLPGP